MTEIETMLGTLEDRPVAFDPEEITRAGAFVSIDGAGALEGRARLHPAGGRAAGRGGARRSTRTTGTAPMSRSTRGLCCNGRRSFTACRSLPHEPEEEDGIKPLPDRLLTELTAHRTLALRHAIGEQPEVAFLAALHALCLRCSTATG